MTLMFTLDRPMFFQLTILSSETPVIHYYGIDAKAPDPNPAAPWVADKWMPYRSYACYYFWAAKDNLK